MAAVVQEAPTPTVTVEQLTALNEAAALLNRDQLVWASGYLSGLAAAEEKRSGGVPVVATQAQGQPERWTIAYGSETGNARRIAEALSSRAKEAGVAQRLVDLVEYRPTELKSESGLIIVTATHGLGDPPDGTEPFFEYLHSKRAPKLEGLKYAVLALGDSSYEDFCTAGRELDERLAELGGQAIAPRVECDVDFATDAESWSTALVEQLESLAPRLGEPQGPKLAAVPTVSFNRNRPFEADVFTNQRITGSHSTKDVRHLELSLEGSGLTYEPGDALGIWPKNTPTLVDSVLELLALDGKDEVTVEGERIPLADALTVQSELTQVSAPLVKRYGELAKHPALSALLDDRSQLVEFLKSHHVIDLLSRFPAELDAQTLVDVLARPTPRLYSIASSPLVHPDEAHLTVSLVDFVAHGRKHRGAVSGQIAEEPEALSVFIEPNPRFRLPKKNAAPIIMIGAGTGVAPYRSFVNHRQALGHSGETWLFFGERHFGSDFLYQIEWLRHLKEGSLTRMDVAFSRDQAEKAYVQHRLREQGQDVFRWLEQGAYVYVCGDLHHMAPDVHATLIDIATAGLGRDRDAGEDYVKQLKADGRYQRDVY